MKGHGHRASGAFVAPRRLRLSCAPPVSSLRAVAATPMIGGVVTSTIMELLVYPAIFCLRRHRGLAPRPSAPPQSTQPVPLLP